MQHNGQRAAAGETDRVRAIYDRSLTRYDPVIAVAERLLFRGGRQGYAPKPLGGC